MQTNNGLIKLRNGAIEYRVTLKERKRETDYRITLRVSREQD